MKVQTQRKSIFSRMLIKFDSTPKMLRIVLALQVLALLATVLLERLFGLEPGKGFGEKGPVTLISVLQLVAIGCLLMAIYVRCRNTEGGTSWRSPCTVWAFMGIGFFFLACDEKFQIHEGIDNLIHLLFHMQVTPMTDRIDDLIVGLYGAIGACVMYCFRKELSTYRRALPFLAAGGVFFVTTVILDFLTNEPSVFPVALDVWISGLGEEGCKLLAEGMFLAAAYDCFLAAQSAPASWNWQPMSYT